VSPTTWYAARAAGIVAYLLLSGSVVLGASMSSKGRLAWPRFAVEEAHRYVALLTGAFIALHGGSLLLDRVVPYSLVQVTVPFTSSFRPLEVGLGVVAADLLAAVAITNALRARLPYAFWRRVHYATILVWLGATVHAVSSGTDRHDLWFLVIVGMAVGLVALAFANRLGRVVSGETTARAAA